ncbi:MAG: Mercuric transport protein periplasmic component precursor [Candidatus Scalindua rubra]|uniref:Mercuric transport protein periplasmic component n=1 Tax=Candidatus Scalindua rubra TaxID=1872076 RepID=A0A1E3XAQ4_9BACT|nr:MAG: Mercuric transport protein periplasmic component precursor [Candidatus Scalindua rubra]
MLKCLKVSCILFAAIFVLSFSIAQACVMIPGKPCCNEPCEDEACPLKEAKLIKVSTAESADTEEVVLNVKGMTCGGCEGKVKGALTACEGVKDAQVSHKDGKAVVQVEGGKANKEKLIEAVEKVGFSASEG